MPHYRKNRGHAAALKARQVPPQQNRQRRLCRVPGKGQKRRLQAVGAQHIGGAGAAAAVLPHIVMEQPAAQQHTGADAPQQIRRHRAQDIS